MRELNTDPLRVVSLQPWDVSPGASWITNPDEFRPKTREARSSLAIRASWTIPGVPKRAERSIFVTLIFENIAYFDSIR